MLQCWTTLRLELFQKHLLEGKDPNTDSFNQNPVGTGRYKLVSWDTAANQITLIKMTIITEKYRISKILSLKMLPMKIQKLP